MGTSRAFPIADVLGAITGRLLGKMDGIYRVCEFMSGEPVWTHQLPRVCREIEPVVLRQHPVLLPTIEEASAVTPDNWQAMLAEWTKRFGTEIELMPMDANEHQSIDPVSAAAEMIHPDRIVVVERP